MVTSQHIPRAVTILQAGLVVNAFGNGAANPFVLVYLHEVRGIPLAVAGLASATSAACALLATLVSGSIADRIGPRATLIGGLVASTAGFALLPLVRDGRDALLVAVLTGAGIGAWLTGQSSLLALLVPPELRAPAFARQRVAANIGLGLGGFAGGMLVTVGDPGSFTRLFLLDAATFLAYGAVLLAVPAVGRRPAGTPPTGSYREVARDGAFIRFMLLNLAVVAAAIALLNSVFPVYATAEAGVSTRVVGALFLLNALVIVAAQLPVARRQAGRRRARALAVMSALFALSWLLVLAAGSGPAVLLLAAGIVVFSLAECLYDAVQGPLTADLAGGRLTGRYMAVNGFSWQLGFIIGPAAGAAVLGAQPRLLWPLAAGVCLLAAVAALRLERRLPAEHSLTPERPRTGTLAAEA